MSDLILSPDEGQLVWLGGLGIHFKLDGTNTKGAFSVVEHPLEPGAFAPPHTHSREDEFSYVLEGTVGVKLGDEEFLVTNGSYIMKPRGIPHAFWNPGDTPACMLELISPAGFERYFEEAADLYASGPRDAELAAESRLRYRLDIDLSSIPRLVQVHGLATS